MKLSKAERDQLANGLEVLRTVRRSPLTGKPLKSSVKRGDVVEANGKFYGVVGLPRLVKDAQGDDKWLIRFEEVGEWALEDGDGRPRSLDIEHDLPPVLSFTEKPDLEAGDTIILSENQTHIDADTIQWAERHQGEDGLRVPTEVTRRQPAEHLEITHVGRHKQGHWFAKYVVKGADRLQYMAKTSGTTTNPQISIDGDAPILPLFTAEETKRKNEEMRERNRLLAVKRAQLKQLTETSSPGIMARLALSIADIDAKLAKMDEVEHKKAA